jgi:hypothetical protein
MGSYHTGEAAAPQDTRVARLTVARTPLSIAPMRAAAAIVALLATAGDAGARSPLAAQVRALAARHHEAPARIDTLRAAMAQAVRRAAELARRAGRAHFWQAAPDETAPANLADWTLKDMPEARRLLGSLPDGS